MIKPSVLASAVVAACVLSMTAFADDGDKETQLRNATDGAWGSPIAWPHIAITAGTLPDGRIVSYSSTEVNAFPANREFTHSSLFDPTTETFTNVDSDFHDMFCAGVSTLEDGRFVASGGNPNDVRTSAFDPVALEWTPLPTMNRTRWYGTNLTLPNNTIFSTFANTAGDSSERFSPASNTWTLTPGATMIDLLNEQNAANGEPVVNSAANMQWWAQMAVGPNGNVFHGGPTPTWHEFDPYGSGGVTDLGQPTGTRTRMFGNVTTYDVGKVILVGGYDRTTNPAVTNDVYLVDLNGPAPVVTNAAPINTGRANSNTVMLPTGDVLVVGGNTDGRLFNDDASVFAAELYKPDLDEWEVLASMTVPRNYHSIGLLLRDGRVLAAGGGACGGCSANHLDGQIFSPPYLFNADGSNATRPQITAAASTARAGDVLNVSASDGVTKFSMVRLSATTHAINTDQRFIPIDFTATGAGTYELSLNPNPNVVVPGYYWMFAIGANGAPSVGHILQVQRPPDVPTGDEIYISDLAWENEVNGWGPAERDMSNGETAAGDGTTLSIRGTTYAKGVGVHAVSQIDIDVAGDYSRFKSTLGVDDEVVDTACGSVQFSVFGDDLPLYTSPVLDYQSGAVDVDLGIAGVSTLSLRVNDGGDNINCDHADWANAHLLPRADNTPTFNFLFVDSDSAVTSLADSDALLASGGVNAQFQALPQVNIVDNQGGTGNFTNDDVFPYLNTFVTRVTGRFGIYTAGTYTFGTNSDDGLRLRVNGQDVIVDDALHGPANRFGTIDLDPGIHEIELVYFENGGGATLELFLAPGSLTAFSDAFELLQPVNGELGNAGDGTFNVLFVDSDDAVNTLAITEALLNSGGVAAEFQSTATVDYWDGLGGTGHFGNNVLFPYLDTLAVRVTGQISIVKDGDYTFGTNSDDGVRLRVNGQTLIEDNLTHPPVDNFGSVNLGVGVHDIELIFFENGGGASLELFIAEGLHAEFSNAFALLQALDGLGPVDSDGDGYADSIDAFPNDNTEWLDSDLDGVGDNSDAFPSDPNESADSDGDGVGDNGDVFASNPRESSDSNGDGIGDNISLAPRAVSSSTLIRLGNAVDANLWNVNPDNDTVGVLSAAGVQIDEIDVGAKPWGLTYSDSTNEVWVSNKADDSISIIDVATRNVTRSVLLPRGSAPHGIVIAPGGGSAYVVLEASAELLRIDVATANINGMAPLGYRPRHLAITADGAQLLVTQFITPQLTGESTTLVTPQATDGGLIRRVNANTLQPEGEIRLQHRNVVASETQGPGIPNYLNAPVIAPDGMMAYVPSKQDNILGGTARDGSTLDFDHTVRAVTSQVNLINSAELLTARIDHDNSSVATGAVIGAYGEKLFVALETSRHVAVIDLSNGGQLLRLDVGRAPQSVVLSADGNRLYAHNFMDRSVSVIDVSSISQDVSFAATELQTTTMVNSEALSANVLLGKQLFTDALDDRLAASDYMSCASCHNEGDDDGRVWDFTQFGEGLRNTISLIGKGGMAHGGLHWSNNFDEVQDFEGQIRDFAGGSGLMADADYFAGSVSQPLGDPKAGLSADLDALAAYLNSLASTPMNPIRAPDESFSTDAIAGRALFLQQGCATCHAGTVTTDSPTGGAHDIGTITAASGGRLGGTLAAIDTPTLNGLWQSAPYLHDGSAANLTDAVIAHATLDIDPAGAQLISAYLNELNALPNDTVDSDADGLTDNNDNCINVANPSQLDTDGDGFGNRCDADTNNDCEVNFLDVALFGGAFQSTDPLHDFNGDGVVNFLDYPVMVNSIFGAPGPSSLANCNTL
ncbi:MAG: NPCBM/NEW2 domain-containing protein [Pseudomonadota bacterium]